jgi:tRNA threonylcarbamoyladenosine biosynthesis protein TsaB
MKILAFDTTLSLCSIAITAGNTLLASLTEPERARQVERLFPMIEQALQQTGIGYGDLDALAVTTGPGSFTGVRIGIAAAKGLRLVTGLPLIGLSGFEVIAHALRQKRLGTKTEMLIVLDARRDQVFAQLFDSEAQPLREPAMLDYAAIGGYAGNAPLLVAGNGKYLVAEYLPGVELADACYDSPDAVTLAAAAYQVLTLRPQGGDVAPLYIRPPDAKLSAASLARLRE